MIPRGDTKTIKKKIYLNSVTVLRVFGQLLDFVFLLFSCKNHLLSAKLESRLLMSGNVALAVSILIKCGPGSYSTLIIRGLGR